MLRIAALNDELSDEDIFNTSDVKSTTKEAQEAEVFGLYNKALSLDKQGERPQAKAVLLEVLSNPLIANASSDKEGSPQQLLALKYSTYKNVASMCQQEENWDQALHYYLQGLLVDESDVTAWYKVGLLALKLDHYLLASHSFQQGLLCNPHHWPCLDHSLTLLYALGNYHTCLYWVSQALQRDPGYIKGLVFLQQIYTEQASLKQHSLHFFKQCDTSVWDSDLPEEDHLQVVEEALQIRRKKRELSAPAPRQNTCFRRPLTQYTWQTLGERLVELYDHIHHSLKSATSTQRSTVYFSSPVDLSDSLSVSNQSTPVPSVSLPHKPQLSDILGAGGSQKETVETPGGQDASEDLGGGTESEMDSSQLYESEDPIPRGLGTKRRKLWQMQEEWGGKRRSTRVRNVVHRKQDESINYQQLLTKFLPKSLTEGRPSDPHALTGEELVGSHLTPNPRQGGGDGQYSDTQTDTHKGAGVTCLSDTQHTEVREFIHGRQGNTGVLALMGDYLRQLAKKGLYKWPMSLSDVYIEVHNRYRKHIEYPNYFCKDDSEEYIQEMGEVLLLARELQVDRWCQQRSHCMSVSPRKSPSGHQGFLGPEFPGEHFGQDLCYLTGLCVFTHILQPHALRYSLRVFWMQGKYMLLKNKTEEALHAFSKVLECLQEGADSEASSVCFYQPNVRSEPVISLSVAEKQVESLRRCQSLEEVHRLYEAGDHQRVVTLLQQTFYTDSGQLTEAEERHEQLQLLQECLTELGEWKKCLVWSEVSLREAVRRYNTTSKSHRVEWMNTICKLMKGMDRCLTEEQTAVAALPSKNLVQLTRNLLWLLENSLETVDPTEPPNPLPWILLYRLAKFEEVDPPSDELPCSLMLLNFAHDCLGRHGLCVAHQGRLLQFVVDELMGQLTTPEPHPLKEELEEMLDQCFYCMYGHPNKRTKARHLQDHGVTQIQLTWERAQCVFDYFKPKSMPEYDSYRTSTVSADLENLLKRIVLLIPPQAALTGNTIESVTSYIEGTTSHAPSITEIQPAHTLVVTQIYYLLGDYYFKNKETGKAIKFYLHDLCVNPERFDSWAGMALARASRLEQRLNSHELKNEPGTIQKQANSALRCFRRALDVDSSNSKLWMEYAGLAFQLHSYLSRTLKQRSEFPLTEDTVLQTQTRRAELLSLAQRAYTEAGAGEEEEEPWLQHYMLGKIAEKTGEEPRIFLQHYYLSAEYLFEERAKYPKKITYIHSPPFLSVEALEVFYRLHVSTIKYLLRRESEALGGGTTGTELYLPVFEEYTKQSLSSQFALCKEKDKPRFKFTDSGKTDSEGRGEGSLSTSAPAKVRTPTRASRLDHTYSSMSRLKQHHHHAGGSLMASDLSQDAFSSSSSLCSPSASLSSCFLSNVTPPLSSIASPTCTMSQGSTPLIGDLSFSTPTIAPPRMTGGLAAGIVLPSGITPLPPSQTPESGHPTSSPVNTGQLPTDTTNSSPIRACPVSSSSPAVCGTSTSADSVASKSGLAFSVDSILGLSSQPKSEQAEVTGQPTPNQAELTGQPKLEETELTSQPKLDQAEVSDTDKVENTRETGSLKRQVSLGFIVSEQASKESGLFLEGETRTKSEVEGKMKTLDTGTSEAGTVTSEVNTKTSVVDTKTSAGVAMLVECKNASGVSALVSETAEKDASRSSILSGTSKVDAGVSEMDATTVEVDATTSAILCKTPEVNAEISEVDVSISKVQSNISVVDTKTSASTTLTVDAETAVNADVSLVQSKPAAIDAETSLLQLKTAAIDAETTMLQPKTAVIDAEPSVSQPKTAAIDAEPSVLQPKTAAIDVEMSAIDRESPGTDTKPGAVEGDVKMSTAEVEHSVTARVISEKSTEESLPIEAIVQPATSGTSAEDDAGMSDSLRVEVRQMLDELLTRVVVAVSGGDGHHLMDTLLPTDLTIAAEMYMESTKSPLPLPPALKSTLSIDSNVSPPKLLSPQRFFPSQELPSLEMPVLEMMASLDKNPAGKSDTIMEVDGAERPLDEIDSVKGPLVEGGNVKGPLENADSVKRPLAELGTNVSGMDVKDEDCKEVVPMETDDDLKDGEKRVIGIDMGGQPVKAEVKSETTDKDVCVPDQYERVLKLAIQGLEMCLNRFPHHYKSLYRLAYVYANSTLLQDRAKTRDLLIGSEAPWQEVAHMPCPALFQERKNANFFQGMWRIPVEEIDRSGSFATHMSKCLRLLFDTLVTLKDYAALYQIHTSLNRTPEQGKKYLRDSDRSLLATQAYTRCFDVIEAKIPDIDTSTDEEKSKKFLLDVHRFWQHGVRQQITVKRINQVFSDAFTACTHNQVKLGGMSLLEKAIKYCTQLTTKQQTPNLGAAKVTSTDQAIPPPVKQTRTETTDQVRPGVSQESTQGSTPPTKSGAAGMGEGLVTEGGGTLGSVRKQQWSSSATSELEKYLTSETTGTASSEKPPGLDEELQVVVLDESHIEINISPRKYTPNTLPLATGAEVPPNEGRLNEITGVWEAPPPNPRGPANNKVATTSITAAAAKEVTKATNITRGEGGTTSQTYSNTGISLVGGKFQAKSQSTTGLGAKPRGVTATSGSAGGREGTKPQARTSSLKPTANTGQASSKQVMKTKPPHTDSHTLLKKTLQDSPAFQAYPKQQQQLGARAMMQQIVLQQQARQQAESRHQSQVQHLGPSTEALVQQMLLQEQQDAMYALLTSGHQLETTSSPRQPSTEAVIQQLLLQQQGAEARRQQQSPGAAEDSDCVIVVSSSDSE